MIILCRVSGLQTLALSRRELLPCPNPPGYAKSIPGESRMLLPTCSGRANQQGPFAGELGRSSSQPTPEFER